MSKNRKYQFITLIFSLMFAACSGLNTETSSTETNNAAGKQTENVNGKTISDKTANVEPGICENEYYPVDTQAKREYKISGSAPGDYVLTQNKNEGNSFTEKRAFGAGTDVTINWQCTDEGLRNAEFNNGANFSGGNFKMETLESSGITIPKVWETGKKWTAEYKVSAKLNAGKVSSGANGTIKIDSEITSLDDKITTPAGDFEAAKVVSDMNMNLNTGRPVKMTMTNWYARDVGLVKQEVKSPFGGGQTVEYTGEK